MKIRIPSGNPVEGGEITFVSMKSGREKTGCRILSGINRISQKKKLKKRGFSDNVSKKVLFRPWQ
jgi:hypothetical protein